MGTRTPSEWPRGISARLYLYQFHSGFLPKQIFSPFHNVSCKICEKGEPLLGLFSQFVQDVSIDIKDDWNVGINNFAFT